MKKMIKVLIVIFALTFFVFIAQNVHAEEVIDEDVFNEPTVEVTPEPTPEITPEVTPEDIPTEEPSVDEPVVDEVVDEPVDDTPVVEEEVDFRTMIRAFLDEWLIAILATLGGFAGTTGVMVLGRKVIGTIIENLEKSLTANTEGNENLKKAQEVLVSGLKQVDAKMEEFGEVCAKKIEDFDKAYSEKIEGTLATVTECINEIIALRNDNAKFKELVALLVTSTPQLASNGYATKILELLHEGSEPNE